MSGKKNKQGGRKRKLLEKKKWDKTKNKHSSTVYTNFGEDEKK